MRSKCTNKLSVTLPALSINESAARAIVSAFCAQLNPTIEELADIKCSVSEAVTNCIVHAYREKPGEIYITVKIFDTRKIQIEIKDKGCGIEDTELVKTPLYTTDQTGERSGMGLCGHGKLHGQTDPALDSRKIHQSHALEKAVAP